jgi:hypothetical protein
MRQFHPTIQWCTEYRDLQVIGLAFGKTGKYKDMAFKTCTFVEAVRRIQQLTGKKFSVDCWMFYVESDGTYKVLSPNLPQGRYRITLQSVY